MKVIIECLVPNFHLTIGKQREVLMLRMIVVVFGKHQIIWFNSIMSEKVDSVIAMQLLLCVIYLVEIKKMEEIIKQTQANKVKREPTSNDMQLIGPPILPYGIMEALDPMFKKEEVSSPQLAGDGSQRRRNKKRIINNPNQNIGHWSETEHKTYLNFLMAHKTIMESQDMKKTSKIFKLMSEIIGTRSPSQCRFSLICMKGRTIKSSIPSPTISKRDRREPVESVRMVPITFPKSVECQFPKKQDQDEHAVQPFMLQTPPFYMPSAYQFMPTQPEMGIQQPNASEDVLMPPMFDQMMLQQFHLQQMFHQQPQQQQPALTQEDANKIYNFSFIQAPFNLNINYMPPFLVDGAQADENNYLRLAPLQHQLNLPYTDMMINDEQLQQMQQQQYAEMSKHIQQ